MNVLEEGVNYVCPSNKISPFRVGNQINRLSKIELNFVWSDSESKLQQNNQISSITCFILDLPKLWNKLLLLVYLVIEENLANNQRIGWFKKKLMSKINLLCFHVKIIGRDRSHILSLLNISRSIDFLSIGRTLHSSALIWYW